MEIALLARHTTRLGYLRLANRSVDSVESRTKPVEAEKNSTTNILAMRLSYRHKLKVGLSDGEGKVFREVLLPC